MMAGLSLHCKRHSKWFKHYLTNFGGSLLACEDCLTAAGATIEEDRLGSVVTLKARLTHADGEEAA